MNPFSLTKLKGMSWRRPEEKVGENQSVTKRPEIRQCSPTDITWLFSEYQVKAFCLWWIHMVGKTWCIPPFLTAMMMLSECEREADGSPHIDRPLLSLFHMMEWDKDESVLSITSLNHSFTSRYYSKIQDGGFSCNWHLFISFAVLFYDVSVMTLL